MPEMKAKRRGFQRRLNLLLPSQEQIRCLRLDMIPDLTLPLGHLSFAFPGNIHYANNSRHFGYQPRQC
ncbi:unnamed protein product [Protopolystoma xenopodis]|uniref:Uncharacterized protein n=1 Tax=Protopolystoma xenopodis TaxID=117903 RepID=A0A3S5CS24_9PLAT|nr:unnamed protein product [Protopolystoma xenopodis]